VYLQNHDQVANSARGERPHKLTSPGRWRAMTAFLLLQPGTPMLFQGQEFSASSPFLYFADLEPVLAEAVRAGRTKFLAQFPSIVAFQQDQALDDPADRATFEKSILDFSERQRHASAYKLHRDLLRLRREDPVFRAQGRDGVDGTVLSSAAFALRLFSPGHVDDRVLIVNLGSQLCRSSFAEPLLAPPPNGRWVVTWSSEDPSYDGSGTPDIWPDEQWCLPGESAIVLSPQQLK
jgi:maltooligosyltrehalose trehalohydrolase